MPQVFLKDLFNGAWGIVAHRRQEIEDGSAGAFDQILLEEMKNHFSDSRDAGKILDIESNYARKLLGEAEADYVLHNNEKYFLNESVNSLARSREKNKTDLAKICEDKKLNKNGGGAWQTLTPSSIKSVPAAGNSSSTEECRAASLSPKRKRPRLMRMPLWKTSHSIAHWLKVNNGPKYFVSLA